MLIPTPRPQTDSCLRHLAARLRSAGASEALLAAAGGGNGSGSPTPVASQEALDGGAGGGVAGLEQSHEAWGKLAGAFQADVPHTPKMLTGVRQLRMGVVCGGWVCPMGSITPSAHPACFLVDQPQQWALVSEEQGRQPHHQ